MPAVNSESWEFQHVTSSPGYAKSNGQMICTNGQGRAQKDAVQQWWFWHCLIWIQWHTNQGCGLHSRTAGNGTSSQVQTACIHHPTDSWRQSSSTEKQNCKQLKQKSYNDRSLRQLQDLQRWKASQASSLIQTLNTYSITQLEANMLCSKVYLVFFVFLFFSFHSVQ